jgi:Kef-type K+ transport system membrane component KefB
MYEQLLNIINQDVFFSAAGLLILGFIFGRLAIIFRMPRITGYLISGIIFGPYILKILSESSVAQMEFIPRFALGIVALIIGAGLSFSLIKRLGLRLLLITLLESLGAFFLVFLILYLFKMPLEAALPLAAISAATAPAATVAIIREYRARGPLTETTLAVVALDDAVAIILFGLILTLDLKHLSTLGQTALQSLSSSFLEILSAMAIGVALGLAAFILTKLTKEVSDTAIIVLGMVLMAIGVASFSRTSTLLTNMFLGLTFINISSKNTEIVSNLEKLTPPIYCFFFVLAGAHLDLKIFLTSGLSLVLWALAFVAARILGKITGAYIGGVLSKAPDVIRKYLGFALIPEAGVAIGLSLLITKASAYFEFRSIILNITLIAVAFNEIIGPICTKFALFKAKEATPEE